MSLAKGLLAIIGFAILCNLSNVYAQIGSPVVLSATRVPVMGGPLQIYGHNFGSDASALAVSIQDNTGATIACTGVRVVTPNRVIGCDVASEGTGKGMHITVTLTTTTDAGTAAVSNTDSNTAFNREAPVLNKLTYSVETKTIVLEGNNFGLDAAKVSVKLQDDDYPVLTVDNTQINLRLLRKRREDEFVLPSTRFAYVTVDGQSNISNMTVMAAAIVTGTQPIAPTSDVEAVSGGDATKKSGGTDKGTVAGLVVGGAFAFVIVSVFAAVFVMRRRHKEAIERQAKVCFSDLPREGDEPKGQLDLAQIILRERASSINEPQVMSSPLIMQMKDSTTPISTELAPADAAALSRATTSHSLEEIDLHDDEIYEKNDVIVSRDRTVDSDSSFSESSDDDVDSEAGAEEGGYPHARDDAIDSSFDGEFSDASPAHTPITGRRNTLQMSSEFPNGSNFGTTGTTPPATPPTPSYYSPALPATTVTATPPSPSAPSLTGAGLGSSRLRLPASQLRRSMVPPVLDLDGGDSSDGSPLPSPRHTHVPPAGASGRGGGRRKVSKRGMVRVPSSRIASSASKFALTKKDALDSPQL